MGRHGAIASQQSQDGAEWLSPKSVLSPSLPFAVPLARVIRPL